MNEERMRKHQFSFHFGLVIVGMIVSLFFFVRVSESRQFVAEDELLATSLSDLRATMENARQSNESYDKQNRLLREQIDQIQEAIDYFETQKIRAEQDVGESVADAELTLEDQEKAFYEARIENLALRQERFMKEGLRLQKKIKFYDDDNQSARQKIAQLAKDIAQIESGLEIQSLDVVAQDQASGNIAGAISEYMNRRSVLENKIALQREILQSNDQKRFVLEKEQDSLSAEISLGQEELALLQGERKLIVREGEASGSNWDQAQNDDRQEIARLQDYRNQFKDSLADLKKASRMVSKKDNKKLEYILENLKQQQVLLKQKLNILENHGVEPVKSVKIHKDLVIEKKRLLATQKELQSNIRKAQKAYVPDSESMTQSMGVNVVQFKDKIQESSARARHLRQQISALQRTTSADNKSEELMAQVDVLEKKLQLLRRQSKDVVGEDALNINQDNLALEEEIKSLVSRRDILSESISAIEHKYGKDNFFSQGFGATEDQLKEYHLTLSQANVALQEKLLVLQMRQDKAQMMSP